MRKKILLLGFLASVALTPQARAQFTPGEIYVAGWQTFIYKVDRNSWTATVFADASDGLSGVSALILNPDNSLLLSSNQMVDKIIAFDPAGIGATLFDSSDGIQGPFGENGLAYAANGDLYVSNWAGPTRNIRRFPADGSPPSVFADTSDGIGNPDGLAFAENGDLFVASRNFGTSTVFRIDPEGTVTTFDILPELPLSIDIRANGDIYVATFATGTGNVYRYVGGVASNRVLLTTVVNAGLNPALRIDPISDDLLYTSLAIGNLVLIDLDNGSQVEVMPPLSLRGGISIAVVLGETPEDLAGSLIEMVASLDLPQDLENGLTDKLDAALHKLGDSNENNDVAAINTLQAFINAVFAHRGNQIPEAQADELIADAQAIIDLLLSQ